ncbi:MAG: DUF3368 domain-containing protein [Victivallaceae bacterium]|nr:DUF3368 domain-containing protein [Victivallaceae bacterium]
MEIIISDAGSLIIFALTGNFYILEALFEQIIIPPTVYEELAISRGLRGSNELRKRLDAGFIVVEKVSKSEPFTALLDAGEAEAISLAIKKDMLLLIDEKRGRSVAKMHKLKFFGSGRVLIAAKEQEIISSTTEVMDQFIDSGYRISESLYQKIIELSNEDK